MTKFFQKYQFRVCFVCSRRSPHESCYAYFHKETSQYECGKCKLRYSEPNGFDYDELVNDMRQMPERRARHLIIRYMIWCRAIDDETYNIERVSYYYKELMEQTDYYTLFDHYTYIPPILELEYETDSDVE